MSVSAIKPNNYIPDRTPEKIEEDKLKPYRRYLQSITGKDPIEFEKNYHKAIRKIEKYERSQLMNLSTIAEEEM